MKTVNVRFQWIIPPNSASYPNVLSGLQLDQTGQTRHRERVRSHTLDALTIAIVPINSPLGSLNLILGLPSIFCFIASTDMRIQSLLVRTQPTSLRTGGNKSLGWLAALVCGLVLGWDQSAVAQESAPAAKPAAAKTAPPSMVHRDSLQLNSAEPTSFQVQVEYDGSIVLLPVDNKPAEQLPLNVRGQFQYTQINSKPEQAARSYQVAHADITINGNATRSELSQDNRQLATRIRQGNYQRPIHYNSVGGLLKQTEQELLSTPADPLAFPLLLTEAPDLVGEKWVPNDLAVRAFLSVDQVVENQLQLMVKEQTSDTTKVYMVGDVKAEVDGAPTQIHVVAIAIIDHKTQTLASLRVNLDEQRETSQISPGFVGKAKIDVRGKLANSETTNSAFRLASATTGDSAAQLLWNTDSAFELVYDPRWKIILSDAEAVIMRYTDQGNLLAQCNVLQLPKRPADRPVTLDEFEKEIRKILIESEAQIVKKDVVQTKNGCSAIRIVVQGIQDEVPIVWIYYNVANPDGRRVAMIFTAEQSVLGLMAGADQHLVNAVRFPAMKNASNATNEKR